MHFTVIFIICSLHMSSNQNQCFKIIIKRKKQQFATKKENHGVKDLEFIQFCGYAAVWGDTGRLWKLMRCLPETLSVPQGGPGQSSLPEVLEDMKKLLYSYICVFMCTWLWITMCRHRKWTMMRWTQDISPALLTKTPLQSKERVNKDKNTLMHFIIIINK